MANITNRNGKFLIRVFKGRDISGKQIRLADTIDDKLSDEMSQHKKPLCRFPDKEVYFQSI